MRCPYCGKEGTKVLETRQLEGGRSIRRRRQCLHCGRRFTTYERMDNTPLRVIKRDGRRERFHRQKILDGVLTACEKRAIPIERIHQIVDDVEYQIRAESDQEVTSKRIGDLVMERLKELDEVAYVRFASVYRSFSDAGAFSEEVDRLLREENGSDPE